MTRLPGRAVLSGGITSLLLAVLSTTMISVFGGSVDLLRTWALVGLLVLAVRVLPVLRTTAAQDRAPAWPEPPAAVPVDVRSTAVGPSLASPVHFDRVLRPRLVRLVDDRLQRHHRLDRVRDPERTQALLGDQLTLLCSSRPSTHPPTPADLAGMITRIEDL